MRREGTLYLRIKHTVANDGEKIAIAAALVALLSLVVIFTNVLTPAVAVSPFAEEEPEDTPHATHVVETHTDHSATILNDTEAFSQGDILSSRYYYPKQSTDELDYSVQTGEMDTTVKEVNIEMLYEAKPDNEEVYWSDTETITTETENVGNTETTIDLTHVQDRVDRLEEEFESDADVETEIQVTIEYEYESATGEHNEDEVVISDSLAFHETIYSVDSTSDTERFETGEPIDHSEEESDGYGNIYAFFVWVLASSIAAGSGYGYRFFDEDETEAQLRKSRFSEWISRVDSFELTEELDEASVESLQDLVDIAIDTRNRVLYIVDDDVYVVRGSDMLYRYEDPCASYKPEISTDGGTDEEDTDDTASE